MTPEALSESGLDPIGLRNVLAALAADLAKASEAVRVARDQLVELVSTVQEAMPWLDATTTPGEDLAAAVSESLAALAALDALVEPKDSDGHCAGPSWAAHKVRVVAEGEACPACGTVMP